MRLIDADKIDFGKVFIGASDFAKDTREAAQKLIDEQPTAYYADKVVDRLDKRYMEMVDGKRKLCISDFYEYVIGVMKSGGIE